jgi:hypothetical protein
MLMAENRNGSEFRQLGQLGKFLRATSWILPSASLYGVTFNRTNQEGFYATQRSWRLPAVKRWNIPRCWEILAGVPCLSYSVKIATYRSLTVHSAYIEVQILSFYTCLPLASLACVFKSCTLALEVQISINVLWGDIEDKWYLHGDQIYQWELIRVLVGLALWQRFSGLDGWWNELWMWLALAFWSPVELTNHWILIQICGTTITVKNLLICRAGQGWRKDQEASSLGNVTQLL